MSELWLEYRAQIERLRAQAEETIDVCTRALNGDPGALIAVGVMLGEAMKRERGKADER